MIAVRTRYSISIFSVTDSGSGSSGGVTMNMKLIFSYRFEQQIVTHIEWNHSIQSQVYGGVFMLSIRCIPSSSSSLVSHNNESQVHIWSSVTNSIIKSLTLSSPPLLQSEQGEQGRQRGGAIHGPTTPLVSIFGHFPQSVLWNSSDHQVILTDFRQQHNISQSIVVRRFQSSDGCDGHRQHQRQQFSSIHAMKGNPYNMFEFALATDQCIQIYDHRMHHRPLLQWEHGQRTHVPNQLLFHCHDHYHDPQHCDDTTGNGDERTRASSRINLLFSYNSYLKNMVVYPYQSPHQIRVRAFKRPDNYRELVSAGRRANWNASTRRFSIYKNSNMWFDNQDGKQSADDTYELDTTMVTQAIAHGLPIHLNTFSDSSFLTSPHYYHSSARRRLMTGLCVIDSNHHRNHAPYLKVFQASELGDVFVQCMEPVIMNSATNHKNNGDKGRHGGDVDSLDKFLSWVRITQQDNRFQMTDLHQELNALVHSSSCYQPELSYCLGVNSSRHNIQSGRMMKPYRDYYVIDASVLGAVATRPINYATPISSCSSPAIVFKVDKSHVMKLLYWLKMVGPCTLQEIYDHVLNDKRMESLRAQWNSEHGTMPTVQHMYTMLESINGDSTLRGLAGIIHWTSTTMVHEQIDDNVRLTNVVTHPGDPSIHMYAAHIRDTDPSVVSEMVAFMMDNNDQQMQQQTQNSHHPLTMNDSSPADDRVTDSTNSINSVLFGDEPPQHVASSQPQPELQQPSENGSRVVEILSQNNISYFSQQQQQDEQCAVSLLFGDLSQSSTAVADNDGGDSHNTTALIPSQQETTTTTVETVPVNASSSQLSVRGITAEDGVHTIAALFGVESVDRTLIQNLQKAADPTGSSSSSSSSTMIANADDAISMLTANKEKAMKQLYPATSEEADRVLKESALEEIRKLTSVPEVQLRVQLGTDQVQSTGFHKYMGAPTVGATSTLVHALSALTNRLSQSNNGAGGGDTQTFSLLDSADSDGNGWMIAYSNAGGVYTNKLLRQVTKRQRQQRQNGVGQFRPETEDSERTSEDLKYFSMIKSTLEDQWFSWDDSPLNAPMHPSVPSEVASQENVDVVTEIVRNEQKENMEPEAVVPVPVMPETMPPSSVSDSQDILGTLFGF